MRGEEAKSEREKPEGKKEWEGEVGSEGFASGGGTNVPPLLLSAGS